MGNLAMDITVILFAGALFVYAVYLNILAPINSRKVMEQNKNKK
jgi:hypothetical protein